MEQNKNIDINAYSDGSDLYGKKPVATPKPQKNIGIDLNDTFLDKVINAGLTSSLDISKIESFTQISNNRETIMELLDTMAEDSMISSALEVYAEDATERNDAGKIVWCSSDDHYIGNYISFLLDTMNVDKNIYKWVYSLCKYGDVYLRLYRNSEYKDDLFKDKDSLNEDVIIKKFSKQDQYSHYVEMVPNPAEMFELTRLGKSYAFIKANINARTKTSDMMNAGTYRYSFRKQDVEVYDATNFVHACLEDNTSRIPEEVEIFTDDDSFKSGDGLKYTVRRGQSLLYNVFKIWRQLTLLENSLLLNRLTKSSIIRIIGVEVGDMPKENVGPHLVGIKQLIEQKSAIDVGNSLSEYTNPGPVENNIYVPTHNGVGNISTQQVGGDVDVKGILDIDYFKNKLWGSLRIPKQFMGDTDDAAGFNGGTSLSLISSRYAKMVKRIQNSILQALTDAINLMLIDKGLHNYINKFELHMQSPSTQEELDRIEYQSSKIGIVQDIMNLVDGLSLPSETAKIEIFKILLSQAIANNDVTKILNDEIDLLNTEAEEATDSEDGDENSDDIDDVDINMDFNGGSAISNSSRPNIDTSSLDDSEDTEEVILPTPADLNIGDLSDMNNEQI